MHCSLTLFVPLTHSLNYSFLNTGSMGHDLLFELPWQRSCEMWFGKKYIPHVLSPVLSPKHVFEEKKWHRIKIADELLAIPHVLLLYYIPSFTSGYLISEITV